VSLEVRLPRVTTETGYPRAISMSCSKAAMSKRVAPGSVPHSRFTSLVWRASPLATDPKTETVDKWWWMARMRIRGSLAFNGEIPGPLTAGRATKAQERLVVAGGSRMSRPEGSVGDHDSQKSAELFMDSCKTSRNRRSPGVRLTNANTNLHLLPATWLSPWE